MAFTKITGPGIHTLSNIMSHNVKSSGIITAVNGNLTGWLAVGSTASFGGNVSIGGTLTYDDVTYVESVGIVTAKGGLHVGAGGTIIHALSEDNGKVGIGTAVPDTPLHIYANDSQLLTVERAASANSSIRFRNTIASMYAGLMSNATGFAIDSDDNLGLSPMFMVRQSNGNVGINTDNPTEKLDVRGDLVVAESLAVNRPRIVLSAPNDGTNYRHLFGANLQVDSSGTFTTPTANISGGGWEYLPANSLSDHGSIRYLSAPDTNATTSTPLERLRIASTGNVSIGNNATPDTLLHLHGDKPKLRIESTNTLEASAGTEEIGRIEFEGTKGTNRNVAASMRIRQDGTWSTVDDFFSPTAIEFYTQDQSGTEITIPRLTINRDGGVGINTTGLVGITSTKLAIQSTFTSGSGTANAIRIGNNMGALSVYPANLEIRTTGVSHYNAIRTDAGDGNGGFTCGVDNYNGFLNLTTGGSNVVKVQLHTNGVSYFKGGNVGIGTSTTLGAKVDIFKNYSGIGVGNTAFRVYGTDGGVAETGVCFVEKGAGSLHADQHAYLMRGISNGFNRFVFKADGKVGIGTTTLFSKFQVGSHTFSGGNGMYVDARVGMSNHGELTGLMLASTYNNAIHPEYGLVFVQGPDTSSYNVWSISPDGPAKGNNLNFHYDDQGTNIHSPSLRKVFITGIGTISPHNNGTQDLGQPGNRWKNLYTSDISLSNEHSDGNDVDGTTGSWTIQEGKDNLYVINNSTGKKYSMLLKEVE